MIEEILNRDFVLRMLSAVRDELSDDRRSIPDDFEGDLTDEDLEEAAKAVDTTITSEAVWSSGQATQQPEGDDRRGPEDMSLDESVFIARDKTISVFQSALEEYFERREPDALVDDDRRSGEIDDLPAVTDRSLGLLDDDRRLGGAFEPTDVGWAACLFAMAWRKARGRRDFNPKPASPTKLEPNSRLLVMGDWGTGLPRAARVSAVMKDELDEGLEKGLDQHVIHLGDVYYSGWKWEYEKRVLPFWPVDEGGDVGSWSLNGNHDMYSGGRGYFDCLLADPRFARQERSSFFSLENEHWLVFGLDTAYDDHALRDPQAEWLWEKISTDDRKVLLLSHHQLFSTDPDKGGPKLRKKLQQVLDSDRVTAWLWGHEHRCVVYDTHEKVGTASCVGHSGVPMWSSHDENDPPAPPARYEYFASVASGLERWSLMGYAALDFEEDTIVVRYVDESGLNHHVDQLG
jgi:hypothetical protein